MFRKKLKRYISHRKPLRFSVHTWPQRITLTIITLLACVGGLYLSIGHLFYINYTDSAPQGIYMVVPGKEALTYGDYAVVHIPMAIPALHVPADYLIIKKVQGLPGDTFTATPQTVAANGRVYPYFEKQGLPHLLHLGKQIVPQGTLLFLNDPPISLDSRYLGPIPQALVVHKIIPVLEFKTINDIYQRIASIL